MIGLMARRSPSYPLTSDDQEPLISVYKKGIPLSQYVANSGPSGGPGEGVSAASRVPTTNRHRASKRRQIVGTNVASLERSSEDRSVTGVGRLKFQTGNDQRMKCNQSVLAKRLIRDGGSGCRESR